ncbi:hypothetical protein LLH00_05945 [bacterium]|nr:hypothetical protein [bacterium]
MPVNHTILLDDWEEAELARLATNAGKTVDELITEYATNPLKAQIRQWRHEYAQDMSGLTGEQKQELMNRFIQAKEQYLWEIS